MLFNSIEFAIFLPIVFLLYWFVTYRNLKLQNLLIVSSSFLFYGWWDWRFLFLMIFSASIDFCAGLYIEKTQKQCVKKKLLLLSVFTNLGILVFFKYFNFFVDNFIAGFRLFGVKLDSFTLQIVLPVGVSFYTFQALSYTIDVYTGKLKATKSIVDYFAFISFFPQLVAGPIERATNLLPQFYVKREFDYNKASDGLRQILWGLMKKVVIADGCAVLVNDVFNNYSTYSSTTLIIGAILFAFQIYGDFSGYSDIAIGTARLFGFNLMRNFAFPYFSRDISEFWRRWHISLSTWFRDYVYIPMGGNKGNKFDIIKNTFILFLVSGFWHGANWTFVAWGFINAFYFIPLLIAGKNRRYLEIVAVGKVFPTIKEFLQIASTFALTVLAWIFFRADNISHALLYIKRIISFKDVAQIDVASSKLFIIISVFVLIEWLQRGKQHPLQFNSYVVPKYIRWLAYYAVLATLLLYGAKQQQFIYFQF